jgi:quercetin dioxygenase-like cupin family protein
MHAPAQMQSLDEAAKSLFLGTTSSVRELLTESLGKPLTPELAASIEMAARGCHFKDRINNLVAQIVDLPPSENPVDHCFADGIAGRRISLSKGDTVVGAPHRVQNFVVILKGAIALATPAGTVTLHQGDMLTCQPGTQNTVHALEDSAWINFFANPTNTRDPDELLSTLSTMRPEYAHGARNNVQVLANATRLERKLQ